MVTETAPVNVRESKPGTTPLPWTYPTVRVTGLDAGDLIAGFWNVQCETRRPHGSEAITPEEVWHAFDAYLLGTADETIDRNDLWHPGFLRELLGTDLIVVRRSAEGPVEINTQHFDRVNGWDRCQMVVEHLRAGNDWDTRRYARKTSIFPVVLLCLSELVACAVVLVQIGGVFK